MDFYLASENLPFSVSLVIMFSIAALEGVGALMGLGISNILESFLPDLDIDVEGPDIDSATTLTHFLSWLRVGKVPFLIIIIVFLTSFGLLGLLLQQLIFNVSGQLLSGWLVSIPAFLISLPSVRMFAGLFAKLVPQDETEVVSEKSFIGRVAQITLGAAEQNSPAEAKLVDEYGQSHYFMVEPDNEGERFESKTHVLIVRQSGSVFKVIANPNESLI